MYFTVGNKKICFTEKGSGSPVILVHGYLETSDVWESFSGRLAGDFRVVSIDLPGHGKSESFGETHSMELMADVIMGMMYNLNIKKAVLCGHSMGGYVTLAFLKKYPEYLAGYCLFHSHPLADMEQTIEKRKADIEAVKEGRKDLMIPGNIEKMFAGMNLEKMKDQFERSKNIALGIDGDTIISVLKGMMQRTSSVGIMEEGKVPGLWILGRHDNYIPYDAMPGRVNLPADSKVVLLENSGHLGFIEEEDRSSEVIKDFLKNACQF